MQIFLKKYMILLNQALYEADAVIYGGIIVYWKKLRQKNEEVECGKP